MTIIPNQIHDKEDRRHTDHWSRSGTFMEDFQSHQWLEFGSRWFNLPNYEQLVNFIRNLFMTKIRPTNLIGFDNTTGSLYFPVIIRENYQPVIFYPPMSQELQNSLKEWKDYVAQNPNQSF